MKDNKQPSFIYWGQIIIVALMGLLWLSSGYTHPAAALTVPTRTPTPGSGGGGGSGGSGGGGGGGGSEQPTAVPPTATATSVAVTLAPTPVDGFITPEPCGIPLFQASNGAVNVRSQPSTNSAVVGQLVYLEARGISGRLASDAWWLIVLADGTQGWVADSIGTVFGNTSAVPILDENQNPAVSGGWQPTPDPGCPTLTPTATPTETPTASPTMTPSAEPTEVESEAAAGVATNEQPTATATPSPTLTVTAVAMAAAADEASPTGGAAEEPEVASSSPLTPTTTDSGGPNLLLWGGLALLLTGFAAYFFRNRGVPAEGTE